LPWDTWLKGYFQDLVDLGLTRLRLLSSAQTRMVWEQSIRHAGTQDGILKPGAAARSADAAWSLLHSWDISHDQLLSGATRESEDFAAWMSAFRRRCKHEEWIDEAALPDFLMEHVKPGGIFPSETIILAGFDEITPQQQRFLEVLTGAGSEVKRLMPDGRDSVALRVALADTGQELKKLTITINIDTYEWERIFYHVENLLDVYYDFSLKNELVVPLKGVNTLPEITSFLATFSLEYYPSISDISATFQLLNTEMSQVLNIPPLEVVGIPRDFLLHVLPLETLQYRNRFVLTVYYLTNIPPQNKLYVTLHLVTSLQIASLTLLGATMTTTNEDMKTLHKVGMILDKNFTQVGLKLHMEEVSEEMVGEITIQIDSVTLSVDSSNSGKVLFREIKLPPHPIPEEVMSVVLLSVLFGVPLYIVYKHQEKEAKKRLHILREG
ncbi:hypothetical protein CEE45_01050, partial [Candidatus Heimdallarchaeota archaeon B3_Heim]